jgi:hypothetical protein
MEVALNMKKLHNTKPTKCTESFLRYLYYNITLNIPTCFSPHGIITSTVLTFIKAAAKLLYIKTHHIYRTLQRNVNIPSI